MENERCWDIRPSCHMRGTPHEASVCPAYGARKSCWEFDWGSYFEKLPASQQEYWSNEFGKCMDCELFASFPPELKTTMLLLKENFHHD